MIRLAKNAVCLLTLLALMITAAPAKAETYIPKVDNFILFLDYSGSMAMHHEIAKQVKIVMAKDLLFAMNNKIPELGYQAGLYTFAPFSEMQGMATYSTADMEAAIGGIETDYEIFQRRTPMGYGIADLNPVAGGLSGKTAVILISDGKHNEGIDPVEQAKAMYASYPNICFHVISFADDDYGRGVLEAIAALNGCSCDIVNGWELLEDEAALDAFLQCAIYEIGLCDGDVIMFRSIQFDFDRSFIKDEMKPILDEAVAIINDNDCSYTLEGHTCSIGSEAYNQGLSERRAASVKDYLVGAGVDGGRLTTVGYGELQPKHDNSTREGRKLNRRVEIRVVEE